MFWCIPWGLILGHKNLNGLTQAYQLWELVSCGEAREDTTQPDSSNQQRWKLSDNSGEAAFLCNVKVCRGVHRQKSFARVHKFREIVHGVDRLSSWGCVEDDKQELIAVWMMIFINNILAMMSIAVLSRGWCCINEMTHGNSRNNLWLMMTIGCHKLCNTAM